MANNANRAMAPMLFNRLLPRTRIAGIVDDASLTEAVYMVAPYGYGKTLAALSWLRERDRRAAWLTLGENDDSESAFIGLITAALSPFAVEQIDKDFLSNLQGKINVQSYLMDVASRVAEGRTPIDTMVIDNFHFIKDTGLLRHIKDFVYSLLGRLRVIIMSRVELSPIFNDLVLKGHICLVTTKELSFGIEETAEYFELNRHPASRKSLEQIHRDTEGWPAAINVVLMTSRDGPVEYGEDARAYVKSFFETEIWNGLSESVKDFLLRTSVLDKLTPTACHALTGIGATLPTLGWLSTNGLFISKLKRDTYKYHRVFSGFLAEKLEASDIDEESLYKKYAWWLFERNEFEQAFPYFIKVRDLYGINQVLKVLNPAKMNGIERFLEIVDSLTTLDISNLMPYPAIVARIALIEFLKGNITRYHLLYHTLLEWIDPGILPVSSEEYAEYVWEVGWLCYINPDEGGNGAVYIKHIEWCNYSTYVPHLKDIHVSRAAVLRFPSILRGVRDYSRTLHVFELAYKDNKSAENRIIHEEDALLEMDLILAEYLYETERFKRAEEIVRDVMTVAEARRYTDFYFICTALLVKLMRTTHNSKEISALTARLEAMIMNNKDYFLLPNFNAFKFRNSLADGHAEIDAVFESENKECRDKPYFFLLYRHMTYVRGLISAGDYIEAVLSLNNLELLCQKYKREMDLIEVYILKSISLYGLGGHEDEALQHMTEALSNAKKYGYIRIFADDAKALWPVLEITGKKMSCRYVQKVLLSCKKELMRSGGNPYGKKPMHTGLTKTEIKILKCLQMGMSYKEIELDNDIRVSTVKSHVHSIYSKLDVNNRTAAVIAAQKQGILE